MDDLTKDDSDLKWYQGITRYQWVVLVIASLGWVFDVFEGQIFVASMNEAMPSLVSADQAKNIPIYNNIALGAFLLGGAVGGIFFGMLSDRIGRTKTMSITILFYSLFTCISAFSQQWWHMAGFRFLVAMGVGGEWAIASAMVNEVFPRRARAHVGGLFHASSVFGTYLAVLAGLFLIGNESIQQWSESLDVEFVDKSTIPWRLGFILGVVPAVLIIWIRLSLKEPEQWQQAKEQADATPNQKMGNLGELFSRRYIRRTFVGVTLAAIGLATFWGVHIYGKNVMKEAARVELATGAGNQQSDDHGGMEAADVVDKNELKFYEMIGMLCGTTGAGLGLLSFGPLCQRVGRRRAFAVYHLLAMAVSFVVFLGSFSTQALYPLLVIFGFFTVGMHAGYAIYFPELFPTRIRGTGTGFCFNAGRILAAPMLILTGWLQREWELTEIEIGTVLSGLFLLALVPLSFAPETKDATLEEDL
ncbi:MAG: MFS transporter [Planctomycetaceae bacterium]|nr:MFS transporter [Planctomycetaceae bacterium]|tara:strand:+ start:2529 stop:3950 length:1422 start_codon:yes stop_codon:yes gene_type:complete